jgi:protein TonB
MLAIALVTPRQPTPTRPREAEPPPPEPMDVAVQPFVPPRIEPPEPEQPPPPDPPEAPALVSPFRSEPVAFEPTEPLTIDLHLQDVPLPEPKVVARPKPELPPAPPPPVPPAPEPISVAEAEATEAPPEEPAGEERAAVRSPVAVASNPPPPYPRLARRRGYEGLVIVRARVSRDGKCLAAEVTRSSGHTVLDAAAAAAVRAWRFRPATSDGTPVEAEVEVPIRFELTG